MSSRIRVLVVDDEPDILRTVKKALEKWGYIVDAFGNPIDALARFRQNPDYSMVLTDIKMPGMSGMELAQEIQKIRPGTRIMVMTAYVETDDEIHDNISAVRKEDIIHKPFGLVEICAAVRRQLGA